MGLKEIINCFQTLFVQKPPSKSSCDLGKISIFLTSGVVSIFVVYKFLIWKRNKPLLIENELVFTKNGASKCEESNDYMDLPSYQVCTQNDFFHRSSDSLVSASDTSVRSVLHIFKYAHPADFEHFSILKHQDGRRKVCTIHVEINHGLRVCYELSCPEALVVPLDATKMNFEIAEFLNENGVACPKNFASYSTNEKKTMFFKKSKHNRNKSSRNKRVEPQDSVSERQSDLSIVSSSDHFSELHYFSYDFNSDENTPTGLQFETSLVIKEVQNDAHTQVKLKLNGKFQAF
jgi:hypothetical protein